MTQVSWNLNFPNRRGGSHKNIESGFEDDSTAAWAIAEMVN